MNEENQFVFRTEFGTAEPVRFLQTEDVAYYEDGEKVEIPTCPVCDLVKNLLIGTEASAWVCSNGCKEDE